MWQIQCIPTPVLWLPAAGTPGAPPSPTVIGGEAGGEVIGGEAGGEVIGAE
jgi:hypothetical protein